MAVCGVLYFATHGAVWPLIVALFGVSGVARGVQKLSMERRAARLSAPPPVHRLSREAEATREILRIAQKQKGIVTPALVTLNSSLSLEEADRLLQDLCRKGYAGMNVTENGRIEYQFPEFIEETK